MTSTEPPPAPTPAAPDLLDVVSVHHRHPGVVIDIFQQPHITDGDKYRVEFRSGITEWFWRDEITVRPWDAERDIVFTDFTAVRTILHHATTTAEGHHVMHAKLGELFDTLTTTANTYLGANLDTLPAAAPAD
ncbi:hypothetical protein [Actinoplanes sp. TFC3]|uniref:hypothetical protein n=1 Tax=Actinoplanes sp. TFC3 TaxID=1710355 RepID=UPI000834929B|nr:hypothetical protein [Actinoplanes sp. TFC3]